MRASATKTEKRVRGTRVKPVCTRLAALEETGIMDTPPEPAYDAITRVAADYFHVDGVTLGFADETRLWVKSRWGQGPDELPREISIFELVLASGSTVVIPDSAAQETPQTIQMRKRGIGFAASSPVRLGGHIVGTFTLLHQAPRAAFSTAEIETLEDMAAMVASQLELRRLRRPTAMGTSKQSHTAPWPGPNDLRDALERREFVLHYQPEVEIETLRIVGLEALIRWRHPERGLIAPMEFIPQAEQCGLIHSIGDWGLAEACAQIEAWSSQDPANGSLRVCVNLSARQFLRTGLTDHVRSLLLQCGATGRQLGLEMTESVLVPDVHAASEVLRGLRGLGVSLAIDDFGTGYSSLSNLHSFPFDVLKIDRSFVSRLENGDQALKIIRTIIDLGRVLELGVVAEGIETREQYKLLRQMGCKYGQGFYFAPPMPAEEISRLLRAPGRILPDPESASRVA